MIKFAFVVVWVSDYRRRGVPFHDDWFDALAATVKAYWHDMSGGRVQLFITRYADLELKMPYEEKRKLTAEQLLAAVRTAGADSGNPFDDDEHLLVLMDDNSSSGTTPALDSLLATVDIDAAIMCHEMGHFFQHLNKVDASHADTMPGFQLVEYGDSTCIMGREGAKYSYHEPTLELAGSPGHDDAGPAMCPPMTVRTGWLDEGSPKVAVDVTHTMPLDVQVRAWTGAPPPGHPGPAPVVVVDGHAPDGDRVYLSLRSPGNRWDQGFKPAAGGAPGTASVVAQELMGNGATLFLNSCPSVTGSWMRLGRAPLRIDVRDGSHDSVVIRVSEDPWRNWAPLTTPGGQRVHRVAGVARLDAIDLFVIAEDGLVYTLPFRNGMWQQWEHLPGAGFLPTSGIAVASTTPDTMDLFVVGTDRQVRHHHCGPGGWDPDWPIVPGGDLDERSGLAAAPNGRDRVELFASDAGGRVVHTTVTGGAGGDWTPLPSLPVAHAVAADRLADGVIQVHAVTEGAGDRRLHSIVSANGAWDPEWFNHGQVPLADRAAIASVTPTNGSAFLVCADNPMFVRTFKTGSWLGNATFVDGLTLGPDSSLAAVSRDARSIDVAAVAADGTLHVISCSPDPNFVPAGRQTLRTYEAMMIHGGAFVSALPLGPIMTLWNTQQVPGPAEKFLVHELADASETVDGKTVTKKLVVVQAANGKFVTAENGGGTILAARADKIGDWELFKLFTHPQNSDYSVFQALGGHAWRADGDGGGLVDCRGLTPLGWEEIQIV